MHCIRYVDDFVLFGPSPSSVRRAFDHAQDLLGKLGLRAYDPGTEPNKAVAGWTNRPWQFLGCELLPGIIRPSKPAKRRLLKLVERILKESITCMADPLRTAERSESFADSVVSISRVIRGWGDHYQFCNDELGFVKLEDQIHGIVDKYERAFEKRSSGRSCSDRLRLLGVHVLSDSKRNQIIDL